MNAIETKNLTHKQGSKYLLRDINWTVKAQEHWVVFGANGCGKTTLLSTIAGYRAHNKGSIRLFGETLNKDNSVRLRREIGFVSASFLDHCFHQESGLDIILSAKFGGFGRRMEITDHDVHKARRLLQVFGIANKGDYPYYMLSKGQRQRVLLSRALMVPPKLLLLDEPLAGLDIISREFVLNTLREIAAETEVTIIYVTHHMEEVLPLYSKALLMKDGTVYAQGDLRDMFSDAILSGFFGHETQVNWQGEQLRVTIGEALRMPKEVWQ